MCVCVCVCFLWQSLEDKWLQESRVNLLLGQNMWFDPRVRNQIGNTRLWRRATVTASPGLQTVFALSADRRNESRCGCSYHLSSFSSFIILVISPFLLLLTGQRNEKIRLPFMCHCNMTSSLPQNNHFLDVVCLHLLFPVRFFFCLQVKTQLERDEFWWRRWAAELPQSKQIP